MLSNLVTTGHLNPPQPLEHWRLYQLCTVPWPHLFRTRWALSPTATAIMHITSVLPNHSDCKTSRADRASLEQLQILFLAFISINAVIDLHFQEINIDHSLDTLLFLSSFPLLAFILCSIFSPLHCTLYQMKNESATPLPATRMLISSAMAERRC